MGFDKLMEHLVEQGSNDGLLESLEPLAEDLPNLVNEDEVTIVKKQDTAKEERK